MLSGDHPTGIVLGKEVRIPDWIPAERIAAVRASMERITFTGSSAPIYPSTAESANLIGMGTFRADPDYVGIDGGGYAVVILDTGIDRDHPFFGPDADSDGVADRIVYSYDFADGDNNASPANEDSHGSNVTSIAAGFQSGVYSGIAPGADIIHLKVFPSDGGGASFLDIQAALDWVVDNAATYNIAAVNMSLGFGRFTSPTTASAGIDDELATLAAMDIIVTSASGNAYRNLVGCDTVGVSYPSADPNSLSVGAVWDANVGSGTLAGNDNILGTEDDIVVSSTAADRIIGFSQRDRNLTDIFAPGALINGATWNGGSADMSGTSMASPHIAGVALLAQELAEDNLGRRLTPGQFRDLMRATGVTINDGDDEDNDVDATGLDFKRIDMYALAQAFDAPFVIAQSPADGETIGTTSLDVDVTFLDTVSGVDKTDLVLSGTGAGSATVDSVSYEGGNVYRFVVSGLTEGTVDLTLAPDAGDIDDGAGTDLAPFPWSFTVGPPTAPVVSLSVTTSGEVNLTWLDSQGEDSYDVWDFTGGTAELVGNVTADTLSITATGLTPNDPHTFLVRAKNDFGSTSSQFHVSAVVGVTNPISTTDTTPELTGTIDNADWVFDWTDQVLIDVTVDGATYRATNNGNGTWTLADDVITPALAHGQYDVLATATTKLCDSAIDFTTGELNVDLVAPTVTDKTPDDLATVYSDEIDVDVTFSEPVLGVGVSDLVLSGAGGAGATVGAPTDQGGNVWRFPLSGLTAGTVDLTLAPNAGDITDLAGNNLAQVDWSYTASTTNYKSTPTKDDTYPV